MVKEHVHTSPKPYSAGHDPHPVSPLQPQSKLQRTIGYLLLVYVGIVSPTYALMLDIWNGIINLLP